MKCPSCSALSGDDAAECPACGLIFAKWRERRETERLAAFAALESLVALPKAAREPWVARCVAGAVVLAWLGALVLYAARHARKGREPLGADTGAFVEMRDPRTGDMRRMPIRRLGVPAGPPTVPTLPPEPDASGR